MIEGFRSHPVAMTSLGKRMRRIRVATAMAAGLMTSISTAFADDGDALAAARRLLEQGKAAESLPHFDRALAKKPKQAEAYALRGRARRLVGDINGAIADFTSATSLNPRDADSFCNRALAFEAKGDLDAAIRDHTAAIAVDPTLLPAYLNRGNVYGDKGHTDLAIADYTTAIRLDSKSAPAYYCRAMERARKGDIRDALADYSKAIELAPDMVQAYFNRATLKGQNGDPKGAATDFSKVVELTPEDSEAWYGRGVARRDSGDLKGAISDFSKAIEVAPEKPLPYAVRAAAHFAAGSLGPSSGDANKAIELWKWQDGHCIYASLIAYFASGRQGNAAAARRILDEAAKRGDQRMWVFSAVRLLRGEVEPQAFLESAPADHRRTEAHVVLGLIQQLVGKPAEARSHFDWIRIHGDKSNFAYSIALAELARLEAPKKP